MAQRRKRRLTKPFSYSSHYGLDRPGLFLRKATAGDCRGDLRDRRRRKRFGVWETSSETAKGVAITQLRGLRAADDEEQLFKRTLSIVMVEVLIPFSQEMRDLVSASWCFAAHMRSLMRLASSFPYGRRPAQPDAHPELVCGSSPLTGETAVPQRRACRGGAITYGHRRAPTPEICPLASTPFQTENRSPKVTARASGTDRQDACRTVPPTSHGKLLES